MGVILGMGDLVMVIFIFFQLAVIRYGDNPPPKKCHGSTGERIRKEDVRKVGDKAFVLL